MEKIGLEAIFKDDQFRKGMESYIKGLNDMMKATDDAAKTTEKKTKEIDKSWEQNLTKVGTYAAGLGAALGAVVAATTLTAARNQELAIVVETVGRNIGKTSKEMNAYVEGVKSMGITTQAARQSVIQMAQAQIDLEHSTELARLAQDAAVIGQINSSEAFEQLITGVQRGSLIMLRNIGITASFERAYAEAAQQLGKTTSQLTEQEKIQARVNEVLKNADQIAGTYEAAMGSAGKQMRSMTRYTEELAAEFGEALLPVFGAAVSTGTDFLKFLLDLPAPVKQTAAEMAALSAGILTVAGSAAFALPKILNLIKALQGLALLAGVGLGPIGLAAGGLAALAGAFLYIKNLEEAHRDEAAAIIESSKSYENYTYMLKEAELGQYGLTKAIYERIKAEESGRQLELARQYVDANKALETLLKTTKSNIEQSTILADIDIGYFFKALERDVIPQLNNFELAILADETSVRQLADALNLSSIERERFIDFTVRAAKAELEHNEEIERYNRFESERWKILQDVNKETSTAVKVMMDYTGTMSEAVLREWQLRDAQREANEVMREQARIAKEEAAEAFKDLEKAIEDALDAYKDIFDAMASGVTDVRDVNDALKDSADDHKARIRDLRGDLTNDINAINKKYDDMLPDPTTVQQRTGMVVDAWDEMALRAKGIMDGVQNDTEAGWLASINEATQAAGAYQREGESYQQYLERFVEDFYNNKYPGLINGASGTYRAFMQEKEQLRQQDIAKEEQAANDAIARENAAAEERRKALEKQRAEKTLLGALELAEAEGELQKFAAATFPGAMGMILGDAQTFFDYWTAGMIQLPASGEAFLTDYETRFLTVMDQTQGKADDAQKTILDLFQTGSQGAAENAVELENLKTKLGELTAERDLLQGEMKILDPADLEDANTELDRLNGQIDETQKAITGLEDPFAIAGGAQPDAFGTLAESAQTFIDLLPSVGTATEDESKRMVEALSAAAAILDPGLTGTAVPAATISLAGLATSATTDAGEIEKAFSAVLTNITSIIAQLAKDAAKVVKDIKTDIQSIPRAVKIRVTYENVNEPPTGPTDPTTPPTTPPTPPDKSPSPPPPPEKSIWDPDKYQNSVNQLYGSVMAALPTVSQMEQVGENLGRALIEALHNQVKNSKRWVGQLLDVGQALESIGSTLADRFQKDFIDPLDYMIEGFDDQLGFIRDRVREIGEALGDLQEETPLEDQYKDAQKDLDELNSMLEDQAFLRRLDEDQYAELLRKRGELEQQQAERRTQLEEERTALLEQQARLEEERNQLALERQQREEELLRLQEAQADLALLEQQFRLIDLLNEWKLDWRAILGGIELGVDVAIPDLLAAISRAMQAISEQADEDLQIASPSKLFEEKGRMIREGLLKGLSEPVGNASQYAMPIPMSIPAQVGNTINVGFGDTTINNGMDYEVFQAGVLRTVRDAIRYGG